VPDANPEIVCGDEQLTVAVVQLEPFVLCSICNAVQFDVEKYTVREFVPGVIDVIEGALQQANE
jgi:hypothetical protein